MANAVATLMKDVAKVINVTAAAAAAQGDLVVHGPWIGVALNDAGVGETLSLDITDGKEVDLVSSVSGVGATVGSAVYYNPTTGAFATAGATGNGLAGYTTVAKNSDNVFRMEKVRRITIA